MENEFEKNKFFRSFSRIWNFDKVHSLKPKDQISNFCELCSGIYLELTLIKYYDEKLFNEKSRISIDDYITLFNNLYENFFEEVFSDDYEYFYNKHKDFWLSAFRFNYSRLNLKKNKFEYEKREVAKLIGETENDVYVDTLIGIKDDYYDTIKSKVNPILILERELKFITMKKEFWKNIATSTSQIDLNKKFVICGKVLVEGGWRIDDKNEDVKRFSNQRIYQSASIINETQKDKLFVPSMFSGKPQNKALLIYKFDLNKICCVSHYDAYTDEFINGTTKYMEVTEHTDVQKVDEEMVDNNVHELFSYSPVFATENSMVNFGDGPGYNEIVIKNPEVIAVASLNYRSSEYAKKLARQHGVKFLGIMTNCYDVDDENYHSTK